MREQSDMPRQRVGLLVALGVALLLCAPSVGIWPSAHVAFSQAEKAPTGPIMKVAAAGDIHVEGASSVAAATAAEAAKADFILGLGDYQYDDGAMWKYNRYFDKTWGPNVPKMYPVLAPNHDQFWQGDPLKYFNGGGARGYKSPILVKQYNPSHFDN